jgi:AGZA family xanthine/uracil permease-like MFS transporter
VPKAHYAAVVLAIVPNVAAWASGLIDNALAAAGTSAAEVGSEALAGAGVVYDGLLALGQGAVLAGMVLGAVAVFLIDRRFLWAAGYAAFGAALSAVGLIHGPEVAFMEQPEIVLGYVFLAVVCAAWHLVGAPLREVDPSDPIDVEDARPAPAPSVAPSPPPASLQPV